VPGRPPCPQRRLTWSIRADAAVARDDEIREWRELDPAFQLHAAYPVVGTEEREQIRELPRNRVKPPATKASQSDRKARPTGLRNPSTMGGRLHRPSSRKRIVRTAVGVRHLGIAAAAVAAVAGCVLLILPFLIPDHVVREAVEAEIRAVTGLDPVLRGAASVSLFPTGSVRFDDVSLGDNRTGAPALTAEHVVARLRFFPFLIGRIEIADVSLVRPTIGIIFDADRSSNWAGHVETLARNLKSTPGRTPNFSEIRIEDGTVILRDEANNIVHTLTNVEFSLAWPSISKRFAATGRFTWNDRPVDATFSFADFVAALEGDKSGLKVRLAAIPLKLAFDGYVSHRPTLKMEGMLAADTTSLRETLHWAGKQPPPGGGFGRFAIKAQTNVVGSTIGLSGVNIELDGNIGEGVLTFDGRQTLQGTLATEGLDLTPYVSTVRLLAGSERGWDSNPFVLDGLEGTDVDLRLSAARVTFANAKLGRTAVAVHLRSGSLTVGIGESEAFGGVVKGTFGLAKQPTGADLRAHLQFTDVDLEQCLGQVLGLRRLEGKGNVGIALETSGASFQELARTLNGTANLTGRKGAIAGFNIEQLLRRIERRPLSGGGEFRTGRTPYETLNVSLKITDGLANVEEARMEGPAVAFTVTGTAAVPGRDLDLRGIASLLATSVGTNTAVPAFELPFMVQGRWDDPIMLPDPLSRIQRSGAAAPLLDAIRDRAARDAVRSALERLTTGGAAPEKPAATPPAEAAPALAGASTAANSPADAASAPDPTDPAAEPQNAR
jgi:AsmA protein